MLNYLAQKNQIDWNGRDSFDNSLMDCLILHTENGTQDEAIAICRQKCKKLYHNWVKTMG